LVDISASLTSPVLSATSPVQRSSSLRIPGVKTPADQLRSPRDRRMLSTSYIIKDFSCLNVNGQNEQDFTTEQIAPTELRAVNCDCFCNVEISQGSVEGILLQGNS